MPEHRELIIGTRPTQQVPSGVFWRFAATIRNVVSRALNRTGHFVHYEREPTS